MMTDPNGFNKSIDEAKEQKGVQWSMIKRSARTVIIAVHPYAKTNTIENQSS